MKMKMKPVVVPNKMTASAAGGLGRLEKSAMAPKAGSKKLK